MAEGDGDGTAAIELRWKLERRNEALKRTGSQLNATRKQARDLTAERDAALRARDEAMAAADLARKALDERPEKAELERLKGELREGKHRAAFDRLAREKGVADDALDLLYTSSGYKAEGDAPDDAAIGTLIDGLKEKPGVARLFGEPASPPPTPAPPPPPGSGQGARDRGGHKFKVTVDQLSDGAWCMRNAAAMRQAQMDGTFEIVESPGR